MNSYFFKVTEEEQNDILRKHKELYNGYLSMQQKNSPTRISTYDDILDKQGFTLKNSDLIKENTGGMCSECGGGMYEGECMECGSMNEGWNTEDIDNENKMDFIEMDEMDDDEPIYEFEYDEYDEMSPMVESFVRQAKKLILSESRKKKTAKIINENYIKNNPVNDKLVEIKNFMHRIAKY